MMSMNFANGDNNADGIDNFQNLLDSLPQLAPIVHGKRGGGRKATNNIGADILGVTVLDDLRDNHNVDLTKKENVKVNFLYAIIDNPSYSRAVQIDRGIKTSYPQVGILAFSIAKSASGDVFLQLWKGTVINSTLTFQKVYSKSKDYKYGQNKEGLTSFWRTDDTGKMYSFGELGRIVVFEDYINAIVTETETPVSFPSNEVNNLQGLSEILANVNLNTEVTEVELLTDSDSTEDNFQDEDDFEDEE